MVSNYLTHIFEAMNALTSGYLPGIQDTGNSVYIVNKLQNNAFSMGVTTDYKMRHMITRDPEDKKLKMEDTDNQDDYGFDCSTSIRGIYKVTDKAKLSEGMDKIISNIGNEVDEGFIYECLIGDKMYDYDQIEYSDQVEKVFPFTDSLKAMEESIRNYTLYGKEKAELLAEVKYGDKSVSDIITEYKSVLESEDNSKLDKNHKRKDQYNYKTIDLYDDECFKYFDRKEIIYYRNDGRKGEILVEKDYNSAIGYIYIKPGKDNKNNIIGPFNVFPAYRGRGYGEILLNDAIKKYGANLLEVYKDNEVAIELYKKAGFKVFKEDDNKLYMHL